MTTLEIIKESTYYEGVMYRFWVAPKNVIYGELLDNYPTDIASQKSQINYCKSILNQESYFSIADISGVKQMSKSERDFAKSEFIKKSLSAVAFIVTNPLSRIVGNLYIGLNKAACPTKLFPDFDSAYYWICEEITRQKLKG